MKDFFNSFGIVLFFKILFKHIKVLNMVLVPFYVFYGFLWGVLIIASFLMWELPLHIPLPFVGETMIDRFLLLGGLILSIGYYLETFKKK